ncbi:DsbA family protein [Nocardiopsis sp. NPDC007018]|uniref:DsbA family protein n=1 Tax=Nocardiopsis sp. NPDC007018 TaxID=3155721 RepID=UPI0033D2EDA8
MRVEIWADVVCPWAYIGRRRLARADGSVGVVWRPYRIDPSAPAVAEPLAEVLRDPRVDEALRSCAPHLTPAQNRDRVAGIAREEGLGDRWGAAWRASSHDAHRLIALAEEAGGPELQDVVAEGVMDAHFVRARDISDPRVLEEVAVASGFADGFPLLAAGGGEERVRELLLTGRADGVRTSPTLVARGTSLAGAHEPGVIRDFLTEASRRRPRELPAEVVRLRRAESLLDQGDPLGALDLLRPLREEHARDRNVRFLAARAYYRSAQLNRALRLLEELLEESADDAYTHLLLGRTLQRLGRHGEAGPHIRLAAVMDPPLA